MSKTVLVIEDDQSLNNAIKLKLAKRGYNVVSVFSGEEAVKFLENDGEKIDFVWLDLLLPGMYGLDFLKWMRSQPALKNKSVAVVSVSGGPETKMTAMEFGVADYIVKSEHKLDDIITRVASGINGKRQK